MKKTLKNICAGLFILASSSAWSQCPTITCPTDIVVGTDTTTTCGATVNYTPPVGTDPCNLIVDTFNYTGTIDSWVVPIGVTNVTIEARGAEGSTSTSSSVAAGLGAIMIGDFTVTPGSTISILVGENHTAADANGGGGGTFVVDALNNPLVIAGGGGGSGASVDSPDKHGQVGTIGGTGAGGGGAGGTAGSGGSIGASFASGAGGGLLTDGADGWTANSGGSAFVNGGAGANVGFGIGGFGGGGNGSGNVVGGGGGGYSGGGGASNSLGGGVGGGGGSFNGGTNQVNAGGVNVGNGMVIITYGNGGSVTTTLASGIGSGGTFPVGISTEEYLVVNSLGDSASCSFTVTVVDDTAPVVTCPANVTSCDSIVNGIAPTSSDNCPGETVTYTMTGATTGSGANDASGSNFNVGVTTVWYIATDASGNQDSSSFDVTVLPLPTVTLGTFANDTICSYAMPVALPIGTPSSGTYSGTGVSGTDFDPAISGVGSHVVTYSYTDTVTGCSNSSSTTIVVDACLGISENDGINGLSIYPNPSDGMYTVEFSNESLEMVDFKIVDVNGKLVQTATSNDKQINQHLDIRNHSNGVYILKVNAGSKSGVYRLTKD